MLSSQFKTTPAFQQSGPLSLTMRQPLHPIHILRKVRKLNTRSQLNPSNTTRTHEETLSKAQLTMIMEHLLEQQLSAEMDPTLSLKADAERAQDMGALPLGFRNWP